MALETFKSAKDYILIGLVAWGVYEAREIKTTVVEMSIKGAAEEVERTQMKADIREGKNNDKDHEKRLTDLEMILPQSLKEKSDEQLPLRHR